MNLIQLLLQIIQYFLCEFEFNSHFCLVLNIKNMETTRINPVQPKRGTLQRMAKAFCRSTASISQHLSGITNNDLSQRIRRMALELGGRETK